MFKVKYAFILFAILYMILVVSNALIELNNITKTCTQIRNTVALAADMALQQATASDEMFGNPDKRGINDVADVTTIKVATYDSTEYVSKNIFELTYKSNLNGCDINTLEGKEALFKAMYFDKDNCLFADNKDFLSDLMKISTNFNGYNIPNIAQIGLLDEGFPLVGAVKEHQGIISYRGSLSEPGKPTKTDWLYLDKIRKTYNTMGNGTETYFLAPTNVGVTYIDPNVLQNAFVCNMDLLMRSDIDGKGEQGLKARNGIPGVIGNSGDKGLATDAYDKDNILQTYNAIHKNNMVFFKGRYNSSNGYAGNTYCKPIIEYRVIDMCKPENIDLVCLSVGANINGGGTKVDNYKNWLTNMGIDTSKPKYICVAKVTIYADVAVCYSTLMMRQLNSMYVRYLKSDNLPYNGTTKRTADLQCIANTNEFLSDKNEVKKSEVTGNLLYAYTTYYAIM